MKKQFSIIITIILLLTGCCTKDNDTLYPPQYVVIKNYGGFNLTNVKDNLLYTNRYGYKYSNSPGQTIIDKGDTLCVISPYYSVVSGEFNPSSEAFLVNKILNRTDTLRVRFSMKKVDSCNDYLVMDEASLNGRKGVPRKIEGFYGDIIELKFK
jgi:hypothetical protein